MPHCPALLISAPASGAGKTTITAGLARYHRRNGLRVRVFKTGPDFLDPKLLARASGAPVYNLDLGMVGADGCKALLAQAAKEADLILIEGVMGLFDGTPSSADLAQALGVPVLAVISGKSMAQTFAAVAFGLARFRPGLPFYGVLANHVASARHAELLQQALPADIPWLGHIATGVDMALPERHLGLQQPEDIADLDARLDLAADIIGTTALAQLPPSVAFAEVSTPAIPRLLAGQRIAIARDEAFSFIYPANLDLLEHLGAELVFFSPLADEPVPADCDAAYLPGGYPELHAPQLARNTRSSDSLRNHVEHGKPLVAECGGMLYLTESITQTDGRRTAQPGLLPGAAQMQKRFAALGMQALTTAQGTVRGHTFHYSTLTTPLIPMAQAQHADTGKSGEAWYQHGPITATYMHAYWPSCPAFAAALFLGKAF
ncbi:cobyrinic acid a,c-diamide synthase [Silvimonas terrae]|uniref:Cobyrinate a,c-diamide synthase n=1 Tax=Silvimonas terrae TaxID=300266 RepID=A0A840RF92_9NEIS|nr:cobyrinate a,c-diamide synthase [Silvimonas terrae]MBB5190972.1 cobyrinic acid a,c-diamide synthase [Silvimonas terrae]